jgi:hypothetical protein
MKIALAALGLCATLGSFACSKAESESVVVVTVTAPVGTPPVTQLRADLSYSGRSETEYFPRTKSATMIDFTPAATFALILPRSRTGNIAVVVYALDTASNVVASGSASTTIVVGGRADVAISLRLVEKPDAGIDGANAPEVGTPDGNASADLPALDATIPDGNGPTDPLAPDAGISDPPGPDVPVFLDTAGSGGAAGTGGVGGAGSGGAGGSGGADGPALVIDGEGDGISPGPDAASDGAIDFAVVPDAPIGAPDTVDSRESPPDSPGADRPSETTAGDAAADVAADAAVADAQVDAESVLQLQWLNRNPTLLPPSWPTPRYSPGLAYDPVAKHTVLFSGGGGPGEGGGLRLDTTWSWDGANGNWIGRTPSPYPSDWPWARWGHGVTYDGSRQRTIVVGGWDGSNGRRDLWEWNDTVGTWLDRTPAQLPLSWPPSSGALAFDGGRNKVVLFGAGDGCTPVYSLWEWDGTAGTWMDRTPSPVPLAWPYARYASALAYDSDRGVVVLFGGNTSACGGVFLNDIWEWNGTTGTWTNRTPSPLPANWPSARSGATLTFYSAKGVMVLFGGSDVPCPEGGCVPTSGYQSDTWIWNGKAGTLTKPTVVGSSPPARAFHGAAYDSDRSRMVLFGGVVAGGISASDTWDLSIQ